MNEEQFLDKLSQRYPELKKPYFTKYLPVDGEIINGDKVIYKTGEVVDYVVPLNKDNLKKAKLFLCSRNIQVGDKVKNLFGYASLNLEGEFISDSDLEDTCYIKTKNGGEQCVKSHWVKIIGEISSDALSYVKERDEFDEDDILGYIAEDESTYSLEMIDDENIVSSESIDYYQIKGPCGHYH